MCAFARRFIYLIVFLFCFFLRSNALSKLIAKSKSQSQIDGSSWNPLGSRESNGDVANSVIRQPIGGPSLTTTISKANLQVNDVSVSSSNPLQQQPDNALPQFLKGGLRRSLTQVKSIKITKYFLTKIYS